MHSRPRALWLCAPLLLLLTGTVWATPLREVLHEARNHHAELVRWRRDLHRFPELFFQEYNTSAYIRAELDKLGIPYEHPFGLTGIRAVIGAGAAAAMRPAIALRADMDGLPIHEETTEHGADGGGGALPYRSTIPGRMHACGHDGHMAMLLGAARLLKAREASLPGGGPVVLLFQPAEEGKGGARSMIAEGALAGVGAVHGLHVWPAMPAGTIGSRAGTIMAASDRFLLRVVGAGGHGAMPHTTRDPVVAASAVVLALQAIVSRETSPVDAAVVTVARFNTGPGAANVIPDEVELVGTVRALTGSTFDRLHRRVEEVARGVAAAYGCHVDNVEWSDVPYPPTINEERMAALVLRTAEALLAGEPPLAGPATNTSSASNYLGSGGGVASGAGGGVHRVQVVEPTLPAEDFSFYRTAVPQTSFTFLGIGDPELRTDVPLHSPRFRLDERQLPLGAALHAAVALQWLAERGEGGSGPTRLQDAELPSSDASVVGEGAGHTEL